MEIHEHIFESLREPRHVRNAEKRMPAADAKTSTDLLQVLKNPGTQFLPKTKAPAAGEKTPTGLLYVISIPGM